MDRFREAKTKEGMTQKVSYRHTSIRAYGHTGIRAYFWSGEGGKGDKYVISVVQNKRPTKTQADSLTLMLTRKQSFRPLRSELVTRSLNLSTNT